MEFTLEGEREKAILVGMETTAANPEETAYSLEELARLADTAGADVSGPGQGGRTGRILPILRGWPGYL